MELKNWKIISDPDDAVFCAEGECFGSRRFPEGEHIVTSPLQGIFCKDDSVRVFTINTEYVCFFDACAMEKKELEEIVARFRNAMENTAEEYRSMFGEALARDEETLRKETQTRTSLLEKYSDPDEEMLFQNSPVGKEDAIVLMIGSFRPEYFCAIGIQKEGERTISKQHYVHIGMRQDSVLLGQYGYQNPNYTGIKGTDKNRTINALWENVDLRYYPKYSGIEFYIWETQGMPVCVFNCGPDELRVKMGEHDCMLAPESWKVIHA